MLAWIRSPRGSTATATAVAAVLALYWLVPWQRPVPFHLPFGLGAPEPAAPGDGEPVPAASLPGAGAPTSGPQAALAPAAEAPTTRPAPPLAGSPKEAAAPGPSFDVVRVEPNGDTVIAGRAEPGTEVLLQDGDKTLARVKVDDTGQFALLPPALPEGSHYLTLQARKDGQAPVTSAQGVAVTVARAGTARPLVALITPDKPAEILSDGAPVAPAKLASGNASAAAPPASSTPVSIQAVEAAEGGRFVATGVARAGSQCRVYLNGAFLADVTAGADGRWSVEVQKGMKPGRYTVRADELEPGSGKVVNRAEVPFVYPVTIAGGGRRVLMAKGAGTAAPPATDAAAASVPEAGAVATGDAATQAVVADLGTATVLRGDSLWRISRRMLGHGIKYTEIYASNAAQIRNPKLIYPGQVFVVPNKRVE